MSTELQPREGKCISQTGYSYSTSDCSKKNVYIVVNWHWFVLQWCGTVKISGIIKSWQAADTDLLVSIYYS